MTFYRSLSSLILFFLISILLLSLSSDYFSNFQLYFSVLKFYAVLSYVFYFSAEVIICLKSVHNCLKHFYDNCFKILV